MKLQEYFTSLQQESLSRETKDLIFQRFEAKKRHTLMIQKVSSFAKTGMFSIVLLWALTAVYFGSFGPQNIGEREVKDGFIGFNANEDAQVVFADEIGEIIKTVGEVTITSNGVEKSGNILAASDKVLLLDGSELIFTLPGWVEAKIVWPAEFDLNKEGDQYVINMIDGQFVALKSVEPIIEETLTDKVFVTNTPEPIKKELPTSVEVVIKTAEFEVVSNTQDGDIDMIITGKDGKQIVENTGTDVIITKVIKDQKIVKELKTQQKAAINGEVEIADITPEVEINKEQAELIAANIKNNDLTISYKLEKEENEKNEKEQWVNLPELNDKDIAVNEEEVEEIVAKTVPVKTTTPVPEQIEDTSAIENVNENIQDEVVAEEGKRVIWGNELIALQNATHTSVLMRDIRNVVASHAYGYQPWVQTSLVNLSASLRPVSATILWGMVLDTSSPGWMASSIQSLISNLEAKWYVPPAYINKLKSVIAWMRLVETLPVGSVDSSCNFECIVDTALQIPAHQRARLLLP